VHIEVNTAKGGYVVSDGSMSCCCSDMLL